ncbi:hypothetical protein DPMN_002735 [Dreissena polymorpha]|uniref:Uncharacterized protein n=1 Tax=Dreissena polymorpha TaxID=45954 RepID=A0A9D4RU46_DREPO|nr:hypothetical protein DPMN_002735 [Dreissena polymorpha]
METSTVRKWFGMETSRVRNRFGMEASTVRKWFGIEMSTVRKWFGVETSGHHLKYMYKLDLLRAPAFPVSPAAFQALAAIQVSPATAVQFSAAAAI